MNRRRIVVFSVVFLVGCALSSAYAIFGPAEYRAVARLEVTPALPRSSREEGGTRPAARKSFLTEVQVLTSRPLLEAVVAHLRDSGGIAETPGPDPVQAIQRMLSAETVEGTQIVLVQARGTQPEPLPLLVNTLTEVYRERLAAAYKQSTASGNSQLRDEISALEQQVAAKRQEVEAFRARHDIVSAERDENQLLSTMKGLGSALNDANSDVAAAEGHLRAVRSSIAAGQTLAGAKDNPTLANIEQRASQLREELHDLERRFTSQYLDLDPTVKASRARLANLEQQMGAERAAAQRTALAEAEWQLTSAREAAERLQEQLNANKQSAQQFSSRLNEYKAKQDDLARLEQLHRTAVERLANLEATETENAPHAEILEAAILPSEPVYPAYLSAGIGAAASLLLGFLAVRFVEFFARPAAARQAPALQPYWSFAPTREAVAWQPPLLAADHDLLPPPDAPVRELTEAETVALLRAASDQGQMVSVALLSGLTVEEIIDLRWEDIDFDTGLIKVSAQSERILPLNKPLSDLINARRAAGEPTPSPIPTADEAASLVMCAAYDAGITDAHEVTPAVLRHTYVSFLLRQGIRLGDIGRIVGRLPQDNLTAFMRQAPPRTRLSLEQIDALLPALRAIAGPQA